VGTYFQGNVMASIGPDRWLTEGALTQEGRGVREEFTRLCDYLNAVGLQSSESARAKYFLQRMDYWILPDGYALPPHTINVCVNNVCNLRCRYCDLGQEQEGTFYHKYNVVDAKRKIELPLGTCKDIVDQTAWFRPIIRASFREPMLYRDIMPFIEYTKSRGLPFWLLTNGMNLATHARDLVRLGVDSIRLSLDGPAEVHNRIRGVPNAYQRMMAGVKEVLEERASRGSGPVVGFYFTLNDDNYDQIAATVEALEQEGILNRTFVNFQWLLYTSREIAQRHNERDAAESGATIEESTAQNVDIGKMDLELVYRQYRHVRQKYASDEYRIHFRPSFEYEDLVRYRDTVEPPVRDARCRTLWYNCNINPAGDVKSFHHCLLPVAGNIHRDRFLDVWNGEEFRRQRMSLRQRGHYAGCVRCWGLYSLLEDTRRTT
jgi:MoaA/NifB/PqqE/SkfB family radical SAM enzyme